MSEASFCDGCGVVDVGSAGDLQGPPGGDGADAAPPDRVDLVATPGQTRFPANGDFGDLTPPFTYLQRPLVVEVNGFTVASDDYSAPGGEAAVTFATPMVGGEIVSFHSFKVEGDDPGTALKRMSFAIGKSAYQKMTEAISLDDGRSSNDDDDNTILAEKMDDGYRTIRILENKGSLDGAYGIWTQPWLVPPTGGDFDTATSAPGNVVPGMRFVGEGRYRSIIKQMGQGYAFMFNSRSGDPAENGRGIEFHDIGFEGISTSDNFNENDHLTAFAGVTGLRFHGCRFTQYRGDAVYITRGFKPDDPALNFDAQFHDCDWDSVFKNSRAALSVESIAGLGVYASRFRRGQKADMPAFITVEPLKHTPGFQAHGINIIGNDFDDYQGAAISLAVGNPEEYIIAPQARVMANRWSNGVIGVDVSGGMTAATLPALTREHRISITHNEASNVSKPLRLRGTSGVEYRFNEHTDVDAILLGNLEDVANQRARIDDNKFRRSGIATGSTLLVDDTAIDCSFSRNEIVDSGLRTGQTSIPVLVRRGNAGVRVNGNRVRDPNGRLLAFAINGGSAGPLRAEAQKYGNELIDGQLPVSDNYNPPRPAMGLTKDLVITDSAAVIVPGGKFAFDTPLPGAVVGKRFIATLLLNLNDLSSGGRPIFGVSVTQVNVVDVAVFNAGTGNLTIPLNAIIRIEEI